MDLQHVIDDFLKTKDSIPLQEFALHIALDNPICNIETHGSKLDIFLLSLPMMVHLLFQSRSKPTFMETVSTYKYPGFESEEKIVATRVTSSTGKEFDISNQSKHSWVSLTDQQGVAGLHLINAVQEESYLYGRLVCIHYKYSGSALSVTMFGLMAEDAIKHGFEYVRHKVSIDNDLMINFLKRLGHQEFIVDSGNSDFLVVQTPAQIVLQHAEKYGYKKVGI
jgi:hypothetical protein